MNSIPLPQGAIRRLVSRFVLPGCLVVCVSPAGLFAQTVVFNGVVRTLGSGFDTPFGVAVDGSGNVYVGDPSNNTVYEILAVGGSIPASPTIETLGRGFSGPAGVAVDGSGNVYVADGGNNAVKEMLAVGGSIPASPTIVTLGSGFDEPFGVAVAGSGNVYVADFDNHVVKEMVAVGGSIPADPAILTLGSGFNGPIDVAVDGSGNVYVADFDNNAVYEMVADAGIILASPVIRTLGSGFNSDEGVAVDRSGNVYVADSGDNEVKEMLAVDGSIPASPTIKTLGGGFNNPKNVAVDGSGDVFVTDFANNAVKEILATGTNFGNVNLGTTSTVLPLLFTFVTGATGISSTVLTQGVPGAAFTDAGTGSCTTNGTSFIYSAGDFCTVDVTFAPKRPGLRPGAVQILNAENGDVLATVPIYGIGIGSQIGFVTGAQNVQGKDLGQTVGVAVDGIDDLFIGDTTNGRVVEVPADGGQEATVATGLDNPGEIAVDGAGDVFIADTNNARVLELPADGGPQSTVGSGLVEPTGVAVDGAGDVFIADFHNNNVVELPANGSAQVTVVTGLTMPKGIAVDGAGDIFIANEGGGNVLEAPAGGGSLIAVGSGFSEPCGVAVDAAGDVFVADQDNSYIVEVPAGGGALIDLDNNGFDSPQGVALDAAGDIFVADTDNDRVVELPFSLPPTLTFTPTASAQTVTLESIGNLPLAIPGAESATNPTISDSSFVLNSTGATACAVVTANAGILGTLAPGGTCGLTITFSPTNGGTQGGKLVLTDNSQNPQPTGFASQTIPLSGTASANLPEITWAQPGPISYGTELSATQLNATANVAGSFTYTPAADAVLGAGIYNLSVTFTPTNTTSYITATTTVTLKVNKAVPAITWATPATITFGTLLSATQLDATSPVAGNFVYTPPAGTSFPPGSQTLSVTFTPTNTADYTIASDSVQLTVNKASQTITFAALPDKTYGAAPFTVSATASSGLPVSFTSTTPSVCTVSGSTVTLVSAAANCTIEATQGGNSDFGAAPATTRTFWVYKEAQTITFAALPNQTYGAAPFTVSATASSGLPVSFTSTTTPVCTVSGSTVTLVSAGANCTIEATQAGNSYYGAAPATTRTFWIFKEAQTITFATIPPQTVGTPLTLSATASSGLAVTFTSTTTGVCTVSGTTATFIESGTCTIEAKQAGNTDYGAAPTIARSFTVNAD